MIENGTVMAASNNFYSGKQRKVVFYGRVSTDDE